MAAGVPRFIAFRFYAELNDLLPPARRFRDWEVELEAGIPLASALERLGVPPHLVDVALVDGRSAAPDLALRGGERVAVYPIFECFGVEPLARWPGRPLRRPAFLLGPGLEALGALLSSKGFPCRTLGPGEASLDSPPGGPVLLTRDAGLAAERRAPRRIVLTTQLPHLQLAEVLGRLHLDVAESRGDGLG